MCNCARPERTANARRPNGVELDLLAVVVALLQRPASRCRYGLQLSLMTSSPDGWKSGALGLPAHTT